MSVCLSVSVCVTSVVFTDCESCTRPISTNAGSMGACEYGLTRRTCFVSRRLEVVAVVVLLWLSWCVLGGADFFVFFFRFFFLRTHTAYCKYRKFKPLQNNASPSNTNNAHISRTTIYNSHAKKTCDIFTDMFPLFRRSCGYLQCWKNSTYSVFYSPKVEFYAFTWNQFVRTVEKEKVHTKINRKKRRTRKIYRKI